MTEKIAYEMHSPARRNFLRRHFKLISINETLQIDLIDMRIHAKDNDGLNYILTIIDTFSKKANAIGVKNKSGHVVSQAMRKIIPSGVKNIQSDNGKEFFNSHFKSLMKELNINHYHTYSTTKAAIVERFQRTLKNWLFREFSARGSYRWIEILPQLIDKYNNKIHRTIGFKPNEVNSENSKLIHKRLAALDNVKYKIPKLKMGDVVRISKYKHVFSKGYTPNWTGELFTIAEIKNTKPVTYILKDENNNIIRGGFYKEELLKTKFKDLYLVEKVIRKQGNKLYIKWLGLPSTQNSWINEKDIIQ